MRLEAVELRVVALPLVSPFRTSFGTETARDVLLLCQAAIAGVHLAEQVREREKEAGR